MRFCSVILAFLLAAPAYAGHFTRKTMFVTQSIVQGTGRTNDEAVADARAAIPAGYSEDPANSQVIDCTVSDAMLIRTRGERCDASIEGNLFLVTIGLVEKH